MRLFIVAILVLGIAACSSPATQEPTHRLEKPGISETEAKDISEWKAREGGYDLRDYRVVSVKRIDDAGKDSWAIFYEKPPPTPPGGHFLVYVDAATREARLVHGE